jgi:hypothetical protein
MASEEFLNRKELLWRRGKAYSPQVSKKFSRMLLLLLRKKLVPL